MIRLTTAKYHTPTGRCIQKPYTSGDDENYRKDILHRYEAGEFSSADSIHMPDSQRFETLKNHRPVYGGGGIMPDVFVPIDTTAFTTYYRDLVAKGIINKYAITYVDRNRKTLNRDYPTEAKFVKDFAVGDSMLQEIVAMGDRDSVKYNQEMFDRSKAMMATIVKGIIGRDLFEQSTYFKIVNPALSPTYRAALDLVADENRYRDLLKGVSK